MGRTWLEGVAGFGDGGKGGHEPRKADSKEMDSPLDIPKGRQPHQDFDFSLVRLISDFGPPGL